LLHFQYTEKEFRVLPVGRGVQLRHVVGVDSDSPASSLHNLVLLHSLQGQGTDCSFS